jgi:hypothetical protein
MSKLANLKEIEDSFMFAGYYRVDIDAYLSVLAVNTLYFNKKNDPTGQSTEVADQFKWIKD